MRLLCTYFWHSDAIDSGELSECIAAVQRAGGEDHALSFLVRAFISGVDLRRAFAHINATVD
eukprot:COSAG06_NODE_14304_length_1168_cov_7.877456_2_plen_62_part_00